MLFRLKNFFHFNTAIFAVYLIPIVAVIWRVLYRSTYYPGWDILGAANGLYLLKNYPFIEVLKKSFWLSRNFQYWNQTNSLIFSLIPGGITAAFPWEYWAHLTILLFFLFTFWIAGIGLKAEKGDWVLLPLIIGCSPALLSFSICGYPYMSCAFPHAICLFIIFHPDIKNKWWLSLLLGLFTIEISWHTYQLGKTIFTLFFMAAFFLEKSSYKQRLVHVALGIISLALLYEGNKGNAVNFFLNTDHLEFNYFLSSLGDIIKTIFWKPGLDLPILPVLGLISMFIIRKNRLFLCGILLVQWLLILILGFHGLHELRPRRFLMVEFYNVIILFAALKQISEVKGESPWRHYGSNIFITILVIGNIWQFVNLKEFSTVPVRSRNYPLPYTYSPADYHIEPQYIDAANGISKMVREGKKIILVYNYFAYMENTTDPTGIPERLYLQLGHDKFSENVMIFSRRSERYSHVPIIPISKINENLSHLSSEAINLLEEYYVVFMPEKLSEEFIKESDLIMSAIRNNFTLVELKSEIPPFKMFKVFPDRRFIDQN